MYSDDGGTNDISDSSSEHTTTRQNRGSLYQGKGGLDARLTSIREANRTIREDLLIVWKTIFEVIYELVRQKGYATTVDISDYLNVSSPSVTRMMKNSHEKGSSGMKNTEGMSLTDKGIEVAKAIRERPWNFAEFFKMIGVQDDIANEDAEGIEHHLHTDTLRNLKISSGV